MQTQKLSISLPEEAYQFVQDYQTKHHYKTRSRVIRDAIYLLQQRQLEACYKEANHEVNVAFEITTFDGLSENETW